MKDSLQDFREVEPRPQLIDLPYSACWR